MLNGLSIATVIEPFRVISPSRLLSGPATPSSHRATYGRLPARNGPNGCHARQSSRQDLSSWRPLQKQESAAILKDHGRSSIRRSCKQHCSSGASFLRALRSPVMPIYSMKAFLVGEAAREPTCTSAGCQATVETGCRRHPRARSGWLPSTRTTRCTMPSSPGASTRLRHL